MAVMHADEASHWDALHAGSQVHRINHSEACCTGDSCTNQAESFFSRLRKMVKANTTTCRPVTYTPTPRTRLGWKITATSTTAR